MTVTEAKWVERVRAWKASGKSADEYASGLDFESSTLRFWASRLKTAAERSAMPATSKKTLMARVVRRPAGTVGATSPGVEVVLGEARVVVQRGFDAELFRQVVAALGGAR